MDSWIGDDSGNVSARKPAVPSWRNNDRASEAFFGSTVSWHGYPAFLQSVTLWFGKGTRCHESEIDWFELEKLSSRQHRHSVLLIDVLCLVSAGRFRDGCHVRQERTIEGLEIPGHSLDPRVEIRGIKPPSQIG